MSHNVDICLDQSSGDFYTSLKSLLPHSSIALYTIPRLTMDILLNY